MVCLVSLCILQQWNYCKSHLHTCLFMSFIQSQQRAKGQIKCSPWTAIARMREGRETVLRTALNRAITQKAIPHRDPFSELKSNLPETSNNCRTLWPSQRKHIRIQTEWNIGQWASPPASLFRSNVSEGTPDKLLCFFYLLLFNRHCKKPSTIYSAGAIICLLNYFHFSHHYLSIARLNSDG